MAMLRKLLLLFIVFSLRNAEAEKCPYGWTNFGVRCYKFFPGMVNWITAERNCQSLGANLAPVHSKLEKDFVLSLLPSSSTSPWVGAHDSEQEGRWMWIDGNGYDYTNWCSGEPNGSGSENCAEINLTTNHCWNNIPCLASLGYVCAKDL